MLQWRFLNLGSDVTELRIRLRILQIIIWAPALLLTSTFGSRGKFEIKQLSVKKTAAAKVAGSCIIYALVIYEYRKQLLCQ